MKSVTVRTDTYTRIPTAALHDPRLSRGDVAVLTAICEGMNNDTNINSYATLSYISKTARVNTNNASVSMRTLESYGYLTRLPKKHSKAPNEFKVNFDVSFAVTECDPYFSTVENSYGYDHDGQPLPTDKKVECVQLIGSKRTWNVSEKTHGKKNVSEEVYTPADTTETAQPKEAPIEAPIEEVKEEKKVIRKPIKRTVKKSAPVETPKVEREKPVKKLKKPSTFSRGYDKAPIPAAPKNTTTSIHGEPLPHPVKRVEEEKPIDLKRFDTGEVCDDLSKDRPAQYKVVERKEKGKVVARYLVDKVTEDDKGLTELDRFFLSVTSEV